MQIFSFSPFGYEGALVTVEVDLRRGIPAVDIVGLADGAVKESRERMQAAIRNSDFEFPTERVLISLSPADLKKEGAGFDLPIALGVLLSNAPKSVSEKFIADSVMVMGELELSGKIRGVKGVHAAISTAIANGITRCIVPSGNLDEALEVEGALVYGAETLRDAFDALGNVNVFKEKKVNSYNKDEVEFADLGKAFLFEDIKGQYKLIRGLQIAAAGGHNFLALGAPGCGKTMAIQKFPGINPLLTMDEAQSVTRIWSLAGLIKPNEPLIRVPPFRMPHQTATIEGICGGGVDVRPGEISLAHNGVLFLDEAGEFRSSVLQMLRVPLESKCITLSRAGRATCYPANFQLLMAVNPCPCGNYGSKNKLCLCSSKSVEQYWKKFSAPLLDRIDLKVFVDNESEDVDSIGVRDGLQTTEEIRIGVKRAVSIQRKRQNKKNGDLFQNEIETFCKLDAESNEILEKAVLRYGFSPRSISSLKKVARTIADIAGEQNINGKAMAEAIEFKKDCVGVMPEV